MQERTKRQYDHFIVRIVAEHTEHSRKDGDIDTVRERVGVMQADVGELDEVFLALDDVTDDVVRNLLHRLRIEAAFVLDTLKRTINMLDGINARRFLHDVFRRLELEIRVGTRDIDRRNADFFEALNILRRDGTSSDKITASAVIVDALRDNHALLEVFDWQSEHSFRSPI